MSGLLFRGMCKLGKLFKRRPLALIQPRAHRQKSDKMEVLTAAPKIYLSLQLIWIWSERPADLLAPYDGNHELHERASQDPLNRATQIKNLAQAKFVVSAAQPASQEKDDK